jgi:hypothetical protein
VDEDRRLGRQDDVARFLVGPLDALAVDDLPVDFLAVDFLAADFFAVDVLAADFFAAARFVGAALGSVCVRAVPGSSSSASSSVCTRGPGSVGGVPTRAAASSASR